MIKKMLFPLLFGTAFFPCVTFAASINYPSEMADREPASGDRKIATLASANDLFAKTGSGYTNGLRFSYLAPQEQMPNWVQSSSSYLPTLLPEGKKRVNLTIGQDIHNALDVRNSNPGKDDFLYAGWLYGQMGLVSDVGNVYDSTSLTLGVVGPSSQGEETQKFAHSLIGVKQPEGWSHQLKDEPGVNFSYERKWRKFLEAEAFNIDADVIPHAGASLGNINTSAVAGATLRLGHILPVDYGAPKTFQNSVGSDYFVSVNKLNGYLFAAYELRAVARNIFIDGNTFRESNSLDRKVMVKNLQLGGTLTYGDARFSYTYNYTTQEFKQQSGGSNFGVLTFSYQL